MAAPPPPEAADPAPSLPWYSPTLDSIGPAARELLEKYSGIPPEEVIPHVMEIRRLAFHIHPYPCIGQFRFLDLSISLHPLYPSLLARLRGPTPPTLLDLGCCFGQDIRKLIFDGAPPAALVGVELRPAFLAMGDRLFRDGGGSGGGGSGGGGGGARFVAADVFAEAGEDALAALEGGVDVVHAASFFHLFGWEAQVRVGRRVVRLLRGGRGTVFGRQVGSVRPGEYRRGREGERSVYRHDGESFARMWEQIGRETGTEWRVEVRMEEGPVGGGGRGEGAEEGRWWNDEYTRRFRFEVERI
ncbi:hypothetical protein MMC15_002300 [Xylographa vitiligo]|nr:hypothetical protein [Xylographa vitiligo]